MWSTRQWQILVFCFISIYITLSTFQQLLVEPVLALFQESTRSLSRRGCIKYLQFYNQTEDNSPSSTYPPPISITQKRQFSPPNSMHFLFYQSPTLSFNNLFLSSSLPFTLIKVGLGRETNEEKAKDRACLGGTVCPGISHSPHQVPQIFRPKTSQ